MGRGGGGRDQIDDLERRLRADEDALTRVQRALLQDATRRAIVEEVASTPGMNKSQVGAALETAPNATQFHLGRLEDSGLMTTRDGVRGNEVICFLPGDQELWQIEATRVLYGQEGTREVAIFVLENPGTNSGTLDEVLEVGVSTIRHHLNKLRDRGLVDRLRLGRSVEYYPTGTLEDWHEDVGYRYSVPWDP